MHYQNRHERYLLSWCGNVSKLETTRTTSYLSCALDGRRTLLDYSHSVAGSHLSILSFDNSNLTLYVPKVEGKLLPQASLLQDSDQGSASLRRELADA